MYAGANMGHPSRTLGVPFGPLTDVPQGLKAEWFCLFYVRAKARTYQPVPTSPNHQPYLRECGLDFGQGSLELAAGGVDVSASWAA
jgi:hypothetical protein